jgi:hypothetical protein
LAPARLIALALVLAPAPALALDEARWLDPRADRAAALTEAPAECLAEPADADARYRVALGRVAFASPALLGGLAARQGLSCDACHRNGHGNPAFLIAGVSGAPGTADVTSALFSTTRGDGTFNPVPIPDLTGAAGKARFGTMRPAGDLRGFVHAVAVDEFQGREPPPAVLDGLLAYLAALRPEACPADPVAPLGFGQAAAGLRRTAAVLAEALARGEAAAADFVLRSLAAELGRLHQRFPGIPAADARLPPLARELAALRPALADPAAARRALAGWRLRLEAALEALAAHRADSLYDRDAVIRWLAARPAP